MGWTPGMHFFFLEVQNTMAAQIKGKTIHHWSGIYPFDVQGSGTKDAHKLLCRCLSLILILLDGISMVSAERLGSLQNVVCIVVRTRHT